MVNRHHVKTGTGHGKPVRELICQYSPQDPDFQPFVVDFCNSPVV